MFVMLCFLADNWLCSETGKEFMDYLYVAPFSGSSVVCCQNTALCHIRVRYCTEKMEECVRLGIDGGGLCNNHSGMAKCRYAN